MLKLVKFSADWCAPCRAMVPIIEGLRAEFPEVDFVEIDVEEEPKIAQQFNVRSLPTFVLLKDGEIMAQRIGAASRAELVSMINQAK